MKAVILAAGYATRLYPLTLNRPKPLLRVGRQTILGYLVEAVTARPEFDEIAIVSNHRFVGHFRAWMAANPQRLPVRVLDNGTSTNETRLGAIGDLRLALQSLAIDDDLYVLAGDNLAMFDLMDILGLFETKRAACIFACWEDDLDRIRRSGSVAFDDTGRVTAFLEKPANPLTNWRVPPFYVFPREVLPLVDRYLSGGGDPDAPGNFIGWLYREAPVYVQKERTGTWDIGTPESYRCVCEAFGSEPET